MASFYQSAPLQSANEDMMLSRYLRPEMTTGLYPTRPEMTMLIAHESTQEWNGLQVNFVIGIELQGQKYVTICTATIYSSFFQEVEGYVKVDFLGEEDNYLHAIIFPALRLRALEKAATALANGSGVDSAGIKLDFAIKALAVAKQEQEIAKGIIAQIKNCQASK